MLFGKRLRSARLNSSLTQQQVADMLGVTVNSYQKYEQAMRSPSLETLVKLSDIFNVPTDWILGRDDFLKSLGVSVDVPL
ncbi:hTH-type transcriptional regulator AnsR family protein [Firmicutes bacterium CAG:646]|nr:hTH-type transcriptional regulator AnsR family protein [Firmicutes bacterium CAG:646]